MIRTKRVILLVIDSEVKVPDEKVLELVDDINTDQRLAEEVYENTSLMFHLDSRYVDTDIRNSKLQIVKEIT